MSVLSLTHHSPLGAWSSLVFGEAGKGAAIGHESPLPVENADLLIGVSRGSGKTTCFPFFSGPLPAGWNSVEPGSIRRDMTPCLDSFAAPMQAAQLKLRVYTPHVALPNPKRARSLQYATVPSLLIELTIDNTESDEPATGFFGLRWRGDGLLRPLDWASSTLCGIAVANRFALGAVLTKGQVFTACGQGFADLIERSETATCSDADLGGVALKVAPRSTRTIFLAFAFHHSGLATYGIDGRYLFGGYFPRIENVVTFTLSAAERIRESCETLDARLAAGGIAADRLALFSQGLRQYDACTQLVDVGSAGVAAPQFTVLSGPRGWRNAIDAAVDHLPWELFRNPWVVRNIFDLFTASYSYADQLVFGAGEIELRDGGMALCRDMGAGVSYSPATTSAAERSNTTGPASFLTSESVVNAIYMLTSYALTADDTPWSRTRLPFARELLASLESRDHYDPEQRSGILKSTSVLCGPRSAEVTSMAAADPLLGAAQASVYLAAKTFCANILLTTYFQTNNDLHSADYAYAMAQKTAAALAAAFDESRGAFPISLGGTADHLSLALLEPLALPTYLGLTTTLAEYFPSLMEKLKRHAMTCLKAGACIDKTTGGLKLAAHSNAAINAKIVAAYYVMETLLNIDVAGEAPRALPALLADISRPGTPDSRLAATYYLIRPFLVDPSQTEPAPETQ